MSETFDPDERFKVDLEPDEAMRRILAGEGTDGVEEVSEEPEDEEDDS